MIKVSRAMAFLSLAGWMVLGSTLSAVNAQAESGATAQVKAVLDRAMEIQTRPDLTGEAKRTERAKLVRQLISDNFLGEEMARESLKGQWEKTSVGQRTEFRDLFIDLFQDSYTRMVLNFLERETIEYRDELQTAGDTKVGTVIMRANEHIPVDYHLKQQGGRWRIRDVEIDGVSIVENYQNTFRRTIQSGSFDGLLNKMRIQRKALGGELGT